MNANRFGSKAAPITISIKAKPIFHNQLFLKLFSAIYSKKISQKKSSL